ncbi:hypothetical protein [Streptomyces malaysiensis]|uniref:hypothetical protein n=1 Tax=Streptomyces malaysiensis TaxID=92644 RepID=UPI000852B94A|nr:hypothetical protein [Streptomyces sp. SPMA113]
MQVWASTDSNPLLFHAFTGEPLSAQCNRRIRPAADYILFGEDQVRAMPCRHLCERCVTKVAALSKPDALTVPETGEEPLYKRAEVRHAAVGRGRRVHYSPSNDDTLCGKEVTAYLDLTEATARFNRGDELCARCVKAAEERAYGISLAAASPLAGAAAELVEFVEAGEANHRFRAAMDSIRRTNNTAPAASWAGRVIVLGTAADPVPAASLVLVRTGNRQPAEETTDTPQGRAYTEGDRVVCGDGRERTVIGTTEHPGEPVRIVAEDGAEWVASECLPGRPATAGSAPRHAADPDVIAALSVLAPSIRLATITDEHDYSGYGDEYDETAFGALVDPRGHGRVAVYWLIEGLYLSKERREPHRAELGIIANKMSAAGWSIEKPISGCVFAWRPTTDGTMPGGCKCGGSFTGWRSGLGCGCSDRTAAEV